MEHKIVLLVSSFFGAFIQELIWWYDIRCKIDLDKYNKIMKSYGYWIITIGMIIASTIGPFLWKYSDLISYNTSDFIIYGAAFPIFIKKAVGTIKNSSKTVKLGSHKDESFSLLKSYLS